MLDPFTGGFIKCVVYMIERVLAPVIWLINLGESKKLPRISDPLLFMSATKISRMIRNRQVTAEDVTKAFISRCKEVNPIINAVVEPRYEVALTEARNIDALLATGAHTVDELEKRYPLLGVPLTVKESIAVSGMSNAAGLLTLRRTPAARDAECVAQARAAGAIPLLVSNTPELCMCWETFNYSTGTTRNPYDTRRSPGGSSGGEAALISSGASVVGLGSDIAGSLRLPAHFTGVYGHKPTPYAVSTVGHMPTSNSKDWNNFFTLGPMARFAEDLPLMLKVLQDPNGLKLQLDKEVNMKELKFYFMDGDDIFLTKKINNDVRNALENVIKHFNDKHNVQVERARMKNIKFIFEASAMRALRLDGVESIFSKPDNPHEWKSVWPEVIKKFFGFSKFTMLSVLYGPAKKLGNMVDEKKIKEAERITTELREEFKQLLGDNGIMFCPSFHEPAQYHYNYLRNIFNYTFLFMFNNLGLPVTNCPLGLTPKGLPVGIQVVANPKCDHLTLAVARELETAFGGWVEP